MKRLALSVRISENAPRIVSDDELITRGSQSGHDNYVPHLSRLLSILRKTLPEMDSDQRAALKEDAAPLLVLLRAL